MTLPSGVRPIPVSNASTMKWMDQHAVYDSESGAEIRFLGLFEAPDMTGAEEGETLLVVADVNARLDLIAYDYYGDPNLWWVIALHNDLDVPDAYLYRGQQLRVPSKDWVSTNILQRVRAARRDKV
jgi:hypothetical protein